MGRSSLTTTTGGNETSSTTPVSARSFKDAVVIVTGDGDPVSPCSDDRLLPLSHLTLTHRGPLALRNRGPVARQLIY